MGESTSNEKSVAEPTKRDTIAFGFGALTDQMSHQAFQFLIFTFYYAVVGVNVNILMWGFIIFAVWDSINDPLLGPISDRTHTKVGRRRFWVLVSLVPFALVNLFLFTPPLAADEMTKAIYFVLIVMIYDFAYTMFSINQVSMFSEMFKTEKKRIRISSPLSGLFLDLFYPRSSLSPWPLQSRPPPKPLLRFPACT